MFLIFGMCLLLEILFVLMWSCDLISATVLYMLKVLTLLLCGEFQGFTSETMKDCLHVQVKRLTLKCECK